MPAIEIKLSHWANHCKDYIARLTGPDKQYTFAREFVQAAERNWSRSGKSGSTTFVVDAPGVYEIQEPSTGVYGGVEARRYFRLTDAGEVVPLGRGKNGVAAAKVELGIEFTTPVAVRI